MFDLTLTFGALLHLLVLTGCLGLSSAKIWKLPKEDWPAAGAILFWCTLVCAGHLASMGHALNDLWSYVAATFVAEGALIALTTFLVKQGGAAPLLEAPKIAFMPLGGGKKAKALKLFLIGTFVLLTLCTLAIGFSVYPDNADSMIYRLPRAYLYVGHGSFMHPFDSLDKRVTFYPLDGVALYVPLVLYALPGTAHVLPSLAAWALIVFLTYRFARELGARRLIAFFTAWIVGLTPSILAQSISTNDEILAALAVLLSLFAGFRFLRTGRRVYFFLAAIAIGLSAGTKGHIVFLMPMILAALALGAFALFQKKERLATWANAIGIKTALLSVALCALMVLPFLFYNFASSGRFYFFNDFKTDVLNLKGNFQSFFQNLLIYFSQMIFSPVADLNFWPDANVRQAFNTHLNALLDPFLQPFIDPNPSYYHMTYRFVGITLPVSVRFVEFSLWSAFIWLLWPWQAVLAFKQKFSLNKLFCLIALIPFLWLIVWSASTLYMEGTATYFTFYLICGAPAAVFAFAKLTSKKAKIARTLTLIVVTLTSLLISCNLLMYSGFRALPDLVYAKKWPYDWDLMDDSLIREIRRAHRMRIIMTHEKMPYFAYMHWNPKAVYETPYPTHDLKNPDEVLQLFPVSSLYEYGYMPVKVKGKATTGMTYIGALRAIGKEVVFGIGDGVETRFPDESDYIIPHLVVMYDAMTQKYYTGIGPDVPGLNAADHLEFAYELKRWDKDVFKRDYLGTPVFQTELKDDPRHNPYYLTIKIRSAWSHEKIAESTYRIAGPGGWLKDDRDY